ncbi:uncharacterized protein BKCO1_11000179 [Diplodia corticola]|uniref:Uncharacterized protein n=1 Tax=Diplodia corticola TaxID=236234 RepID=A0A1J9R4W1_9PEZI|nr:uncharacterized protein BKCO1_11000179 [Diplodia corticola]OJD36510.1 hypothetical protein BKCO1_11000179 [Diplodia corticola]
MQVSQSTLPLDKGTTYNQKKWANDLPQHPRAFWKAGMKALRKLCNGGKPRRLKEVIPFLSLTRAIAQTTGFRQGLVSDFDQDLHLWMTIFGDDVSKRELFANAINDIWSVDLQSYVLDFASDQPIPEETLERLQKLAEELLEQASSTFGCLGGLEKARLKWQQKYPDGSPPEARPYGEDLTHIDDDTPLPLSRGSGDEPFREDWKPERISMDCASPDRIHLMLLASVAFACAISFILSKPEYSIFRIDD